MKSKSVFHKTIAEDSNMIYVKCFYHPKSGNMPKTTFLNLCVQATNSKGKIVHGPVYIAAVNAGYEFHNILNLSLKQHIQLANPNATVI